MAGVPRQAPLRSHPPALVPLQAGTRVPRSRPCLSASSCHEPSLAESCVQPLGPDGHLSLTPRGERASTPRAQIRVGSGPVQLPRFGGRGRLLNPLGGFLLRQHLSQSENRPARRPAVSTPGEGTPPPTRGAFQTQTRRSKAAFLFFSPAIEGKKGTLRPIHIHTRKHLR